MTDNADADLDFCCVADICAHMEQRTKSPHASEVTEVAIANWSQSPREIARATKQEMRRRMKLDPAKFGFMMWISLASLIVQIVRMLVELWNKNHKAAQVICSVARWTPVAASMQIKMEW